VARGRISVWRDRADLPHAIAARIFDPGTLPARLQHGERTARKIIVRLTDEPEGFAR
jgi:hypothetical protein